MGRLTRSMVEKVNTIKPSVKDSKDIEMIVLDEEEHGPFSHDCPDMYPKPTNHPVEKIPYIPDKDPQMDSVPDPQIKGKTAEGDPIGSYRISEAVHPLFVN